MCNINKLNRQARGEWNALRLFVSGLDRHAWLYYNKFNLMSVQSGQQRDTRVMDEKKEGQSLLIDGGTVRAL